MGMKTNLLGFLIMFVSFALYQILNKGHRLSFQCSIFSISCQSLNDIQLAQGSTYDKRFEKVVEEFRQNFVDGLEIGAQLSIWYRNKNVVNIASGLRNIKKNLPFEISTPQLVYSSSKGVCNLVIAMLVDRGLLNYEEKIAKYWPEFAENNKKDVTLGGKIFSKIF
jgi:CubicO group peptidase (beta-lactamase class C family)